MPVDDGGVLGPQGCVGSLIIAEFEQIDAARQNLGSVGSYGWGGAAGTRFWVDPQEGLVGLLMIQFMPGDHYPIQDEFEVLTYQALVDG